MNLKRTTKNYVTPVNEDTKRGYKLRKAQEQEALEEIDGFIRSETEEPTPGWFSEGCEEVYHP